MFKQWLNPEQALIRLLIFVQEEKQWYDFVMVMILSFDPTDVKSYNYVECYNMTACVPVG